MIKKYSFKLNVHKGEKISFEDAYPLYAELLEGVEDSSAAMMHEKERLSLSQFLQPIDGGNSAYWNIALFGAEQMESFSARLEGRDSITLKNGGRELLITERVCKTINSASELMAQSEFECDASRYCLRFISPTAYRSGGEYVFMPSPRLILRSAANMWGQIFPDNTLDDEDALQILENGVKITGYDIKSVYFPLKGVKIPGFTGSVTLNAKLSAPILQVFKCLLALMSYTGSGIKTKLGMGGVTVKEFQRKNKIRFARLSETG